MTLGQLIKRYREEHDMSMAEFARRAGMSTSQIHYIENEKNSRNTDVTRPTTSALMKCSRAMGMPLEDAMNIIYGANTEIGTITDEETRIIVAYRNANSSIRQAIKDILHI